MIIRGEATFVLTKCDDERRDRNGSGVFCVFA